MQNHKEECHECGAIGYLFSYGLCIECYDRFEDECAEIERNNLDKLINMPYSVRIRLNKEINE